MFGEGLPDEFEGEAESGEDRAKRYDFGLGLAPLSLLVAWSSEEAGHLRGVGQIDIGAVDREEPEDSLPEEGRGELGFEAIHKMFPELAPKPDGELFPGLAESLLGDTAFVQPWAGDAQKSPRSAETLGHGGCL